MAVLVGDRNVKFLVYSELEDSVFESGLLPHVVVWVQKKLPGLAQVRASRNPHVEGRAAEEVLD
jgi:hypothetical protein